MLTSDLVRARRRAGHIEVPPLRAAERERMLRVADEYVGIARACVGQPRRELDRACDEVAYETVDEKRVKGLRKLLEDRCAFEVASPIEPSQVRRAVFAQAAAARRELAATASFDEAAVLAAAAGELGIASDDIDSALYADLKQNQRLAEFDAVSGAGLVDLYETSQRQAVLLKATRVVVRLEGADPAGHRNLLRQLKFRRLLCTIERQPDGSTRIEIDGPFSLFQSVTKYGLQLALLLPALTACAHWQLDAEVVWGKRRERCQFHLDSEQLHREAGSAGPPPSQAVALPDEVEQLRARFAKLDTEWTVEVASELLDLPGVGVCVPDLTFTHTASGQRAHLEVMGYWSRAAVWRRVELVEAGLPHPILFAVSHRLRVSEDALGEDLPGQLLVYKGALSPRLVAERLNQLLRRPQA